MTWEWVIFLGTLFTFILWLRFGIKAYMRKVNGNKN